MTKFVVGAMLEVYSALFRCLDSVLFAFVGVVDAAGFEADDLPLAKATVVDAGVAVLAADVAGSVGACQVGAGGDDGGVAVDADLEVVEIEGGDVEGSGAAQGDGFGLGFDGPAGADANVVVGQEPVHDGHVIAQLSVAPLHFKRFYFLVLLVAGVVGQSGEGRLSECPERETKQKEAYAGGRRKRIPDAEMSAHVQIGW
jgi:hypothetical protein